MSVNAPVTVIGGGLAGVECAWQLARRGHRVRLFEMRPVRTTDAHETDRLAEMVCSNSFRSDNPANAVGLLKREMERIGSLVLSEARRAAVPAGDALAVDRMLFADGVTTRIVARPEIELIRVEVETLPDAGEGFVVVATGPLTSPSLAESLRLALGDQYLYFYDAVAPIVDAASIDTSRLFAASRWGKGGGADYLNIPLTRAEYEAFVDGRRRILLVAIALFLSGATACAFARSMPGLIAARGIQGLGAGGLIPTAPTVSGDLFSVRERARVQALFSGVWGFASLVGPLLGAGMTVTFGWRSIFSINIPLGILAFILVATMLVESRSRRSDPLDVAGALTLAAAVSALLLAVLYRPDREAPLAPRLLLGALGISLALFFVRLERRRPHPLIPPSQWTCFSVQCD